MMDKTKLKKLCKQAFTLPFIIADVGKSKTMIKVELKTPRTSSNAVYRIVKYWNKEEFMKMPQVDTKRHLKELLNDFLIGMIEKIEKKQG